MERPFKWEDGSCHECHEDHYVNGRCQQCSKSTLLDDVLSPSGNNAPAAWVRESRSRMARYRIEKATARNGGPIVARHLYGRQRIPLKMSWQAASSPPIGGGIIKVVESDNIIPGSARFITTRDKAGKNDFLRLFGISGEDSQLTFKRVLEQDTGGGQQGRGNCKSFATAISWLQEATVEEIGKRFILFREGRAGGGCRTGVAFVPATTDVTVRNGRIENISGPVYATFENPARAPGATRVVRTRRPGLALLMLAMDQYSNGESGSSCKFGTELFTRQTELPSLSDPDIHRMNLASADVGVIDPGSLFSAQDAANRLCLAFTNPLTEHGWFGREPIVVAGTVQSRTDYFNPSKPEVPRRFTIPVKLPAVEGRRRLTLVAAHAYAVVGVEGCPRLPNMPPPLVRIINPFDWSKDWLIDVDRFHKYFAFMRVSSRGRQR